MPVNLRRSKTRRGWSIITLTWFWIVECFQHKCPILPKRSCRNQWLSLENFQLVCGVNANSLTNTSTMAKGLNKALAVINSSKVHQQKNLTWFSTHNPIFNDRLTYRPIAEFHSIGRYCQEIHSSHLSTSWKYRTIKVEALDSGWCNFL